jgi:REase_MTES_1575
VVPQYGVGGYRVDFAATHPQDAERMILAIEADGASYRESGSVRDRDRLRGEHLQRLGWRFHRLWSTSWFHDPQAEVNRLRDAYQRAIPAADLRAQEPGPPPPATGTAASPVAGPVAPPATGPGSRPGGPPGPGPAPVPRPRRPGTELDRAAPHAAVEPARPPGEDRPARRG